MTNVKEWLAFLSYIHDLSGGPLSLSLFHNSIPSSSAPYLNLNLTFSHYSIQVDILIQKSCIQHKPLRLYNKISCNSFKNAKQENDKSILITPIFHCQDFILFYTYIDTLDSSCDTFMAPTRCFPVFLTPLTRKSISSYMAAKTLLYNMKSSGGKNAPCLFPISGVKMSLFALFSRIMQSTQPSSVLIRGQTVL